MYNEETAYGKRIVLWVVGLAIVLGMGGWIVERITKPAETIIDNAIPNYEDFQEIYNTCSKINSDLGTIRGIDENDRYFASFSKASMIAAKRQQMTRWVEEYNAKSKMWNRALWKSSKLPYQLNVSDFNNYDGGER